MDYQFKPLGKKCAATGAELAPGSICHSALFDEDGELQRLDYSEQGWSGPPPGAVATWTCLVPVPVQTKKKNPLDPAVLMSYFEQLMEAGNPLQEKLRYILALLLIQKKRLRCDGTRQEGEESYLQLAGAQGEGAYEIRDLQLDDEEMFELQRELNAHLAAEWGDGIQEPNNA